MTGTITINNIVFEWHECITCGVVYTCPQTLIKHQRQNGGYHTCCNGHSQGWGKEQSENEKTRRERDRLRQQLAEKNDEIARQERMRKDAEGRLSQATQKAAKVKKRSSAGVCPCCNRTVGQMARHMKSKHPQFVAEAISGPAASSPTKTH